MTTEEFDRQSFGKGDKAKYKDGNIYDVAIVDFEERIIGLLMNIDGAEPNEVSFVRCENVEYIPFETEQNDEEYNFKIGYKDKDGVLQEVVITCDSLESGVNQFKERFGDIKIVVTAYNYTQAMGLLSYAVEYTDDYKHLPYGEEMAG